MKSKKGLFIIALVLIALILVLATSSYAAKQTYSPDDFKGSIDTEASGTPKIKTTGGKVVGLIRVIGTIVAVGMLIVLGIKYMMGSAEERAEYKKTLFPYFIGAVLIFGAANLTQVIYTWATNI